jgi:hypothetical protein
MTCNALCLCVRSVVDLDPFANIFRLADDEPVPMMPFSQMGAKVAFCKAHLWPKAGPGTKATWENAQVLLKKHGASIERSRG